MSANIIKNTILLSIFTLALLNNLIAQTNYKMTVVEESNYDDNTHQLSVYIESTSSEFELTSYQCALGFNQDLFSSNLEFSYIEGSSDLINEPNLYVGIDDVDGQKELTFVSYVGNDIISKEKTLVGKFIIEGANSGAINTVWDFDGTISTIVTGEDFANITNASNHSSTEKIEDELLAGIHEMNINASNLPSGVYIYQLNVDNKYTDVKKMSLIK